MDTRTANREASQVGLGVIEEKLCESNITEQENLWKLIAKSRRLEVAADWIEQAVQRNAVLTAK